MKKRETKSPIKNLPVRQPGQSLREKSLNIVEDEFLPWFLTGTVLVCIALEAWGLYFVHSLLLPVIITLAALVVLPVAAIKFRNVRSELRTLRAGQIGEEAVGQFLEEKLRPDGFQILHDIPGDDFNVD